MKKKIFLSFLIACTAVSAMAIDLPKQGFGIQIGWAQPILRLNNRTNPATAKDSLSTIVKLNGFKVGLTYDASFVAGFGSSIGLNYTFGVSNSGWKSNNIYGMDYPRSRQLITSHEIEVFVDWQYKFEVAKETYLMLYTGPTIQCGLQLDMRADHQRDYDTPIEYQHYDGYKSDNENETFKRLNVTWGVGAGFQYKRYFVRGGYDFGLLNPYAHAQFVDPVTGAQLDRYTHGRLDQWSIKLGVYLWYAD